MKKLKQRGNDLPQVTWLVRGCADTWTHVWSFAVQQGFPSWLSVQWFFPLIPEPASPVVHSPYLLPGRSNYKQPRAWTSCRWHLAPISLIEVRHNITTKRPRSWAAGSPLQSLGSHWVWKTPPLPGRRILWLISKCGWGRDRKKKETQIPHSSQQIVSQTVKGVLNTKSLFPQLREQKRTHIWHLNPQASGMLGGGLEGLPRWRFSQN